MAMDNDMGILMDIHEKSMDMDVEYHIHGNPCNRVAAANITPLETTREPPTIRSPEIDERLCMGRRHYETNSQSKLHMESLMSLFNDEAT
jgi:hypothetical protein